MEATPRYRAFSIITNLSDLESFILHDPASQHLYHQYLTRVFHDGRKSNHIPFFVDIVRIGERAVFSQTNVTEYLADLHVVFEKYFLEGSELLIDIPQERLEQVRRNIQKNLTLLAFKPAIKVVVRDLAFIYLDRYNSF
jgi:hypothetical protein